MAHPNLSSRTDEDGGPFAIERSGIADLGACAASVPSSDECQLYATWGTSAAYDALVDDYARRLADTWRGLG